MKKLIYSALIVLTASFGYSQNNSQNNETINNGRIIGSFELGSQEVTTILDESTDCVRKTSPHTKGLFTPNENVEIILKENKQSAEVRKPALPEKVFANKKCEDELLELKPNSFNEIADFFGLHHNNILYYCMFENPIIKKNQYISRFNQLYKGTDFQGYGNINLMNKYLEKITSVNTMITHLLNTKTQIAENINITEVEKNSSISIIELTISFLNDNNIDHYISELNILRTNIETLKTNESLISPNQEMVKTLSLIGVAQYSTEYWLEQSDDLYDDTPDEPQPVAPWVAADVVGGVVGVYGNILVDVATGQNSSWTSYGVSFLWGAATTSLGGWFKW